MLLHPDDVSFSLLLLTFSGAISPLFYCSIWHILCNELEITKEQKAKITSRRNRIRHICADLKSCTQLLKDLRSKVEEKNKSLDAEMTELQSVLSPVQAAKFILWVSNNPACMQMLNKLWISMAIS